MDVEAGAVFVLPSGHLAVVTQTGLAGAPPTLGAEPWRGEGVDGGCGEERCANDEGLQGGSRIRLPMLSPIADYGGHQADEVEGGEVRKRR